MIRCPVAEDDALNGVEKTFRSGIGYQALSGATSVSRYG
jgi:hypothetical protein